MWWRCASYWRHGAVAEVASDAELTVTGIAARQAGCDFDVWELLWQVVAVKRIAIRARWVNAHGDEHPEYFTQYMLTVRDSVGNGVADKLVAVPVLQMVSHTQRIQGRLVALVLGLVRGFPRLWVGGGQQERNGWAGVPRLALTYPSGDGLSVSHVRLVRKCCTWQHC